MKHKITLLSLATVLLMAFPLMISAQPETRVVKKTVVISGDTVITTLNQDGKIDTSMVFHFDFDADDMEEAMQKLSEAMEKIEEEVVVNLDEKGLNDLSVETYHNGSSAIIRLSSQGETEITDINMDSLKESIELRIKDRKHSTLEKMSGNSPKHKIKVVHAGMPFLIIKAEKTAEKELNITVVDQNNDIVFRKSIYSQEAILAEQLELKNLKNGTYFVVIKIGKETVRYKLHIN